MKHPFLSFSKRLSRHILVVIILTNTLVTLMIIAFATSLLKDMTKAYFLSELKTANEQIEKSLYLKIDRPMLVDHMRLLDDKLNEYHPLFPKEGNEKEYRDVWAYNIIIDSVGKYVYHPDMLHTLKRSFEDDICNSSEELRQSLVQGMASGETGEQRITVNGKESYIFYASVKGSHWKNAIVVPKDGLIFPTIVTILILLVFLILGLMLAYWISRITIRRSTQPLQLLAKSADEVAKGNFENPLPELKHNDEISQLRDSFGNMQQSLTTYIEQLKTTTAQKAAIESELSIAREIQMSMVPTVFPTRPDIDIYGSMTPAKAVGGDLYDFFVRDNELIFCIGDVSGKGVPAALLMMVTKSLFRAYSTHELMPDQIVSRMNHDLSQNNESCMFVTFFVGILHLTSGELRYCNAGHEAPFLIDQEVCQLPVEYTYPVGISPDTDYMLQTEHIEPQTTILLYTDGLNEATSRKQELFGEERINAELKRAIQDGQLASKDVVERMTQAVSEFVGEAEQSDDLTMMAIRRLNL